MRLDNPAMKAAHAALDAIALAVDGEDISRHCRSVRVDGSVITVSYPRLGHTVIVTADDPAGLPEADS